MLTKLHDKNFMKKSKKVGMDMCNNDNLLFISELAEKLKVTEAAISTWIKTNKIPNNIFVSVGRIRIRKNLFEKHFDIDLDNILTYEEAAEMLRISKDNIKTLFSREQLPDKLRARIVGIVRIKKDLLIKFINGE